MSVLKMAIVMWRANLCGASVCCSQTYAAVKLLIDKRLPERESVKFDDSLSRIVVVIKGLSAAGRASSAAPPLAEWQGKRLQFGRCGGLSAKALLAPDCCSQPRREGGREK